MRRSVVRRLLVVLLCLAPLATPPTASVTSARADDGPGAEQVVSDPDGLLASIGVDGNVWIAHGDGTDPRPVTADGSTDLPYSGLVWSPDGEKLLLRRVTEVDASGSFMAYQDQLLTADGSWTVPALDTCRLEGFMPDSAHLAWHCGEFSDERIDADTVDLEQWSMGFLTQTDLDGANPELVLPYQRGATPAWAANKPAGRLAQGQMQVSESGNAIVSNETGIAHYLSVYSLDDGSRTNITIGGGMLIGEEPELIAATCSGECGFPGYHPTFTLERYDLNGALLQTYETYPYNYSIDLRSVTTDRSTAYYTGHTGYDGPEALFALDLDSGETTELTNSTLGDLFAGDSGTCNAFAFQPTPAELVIPGGAATAAEPDAPSIARTDATDEAQASASGDVYTIADGTGRSANDRDAGDGSAQATETPVYRGGDGGGDPLLVHYPGWVFYAGKTDGQWDLYTHNPRTGEDVRLTDTPWDEWAPAGNRIADSLYFLSDESGTTQLWFMGPDDWASRHQETDYTGPGEITYFHYGPEWLSMKLTVADQAAGEAWLLELRMGDGSIMSYAGSWRSLPSFTPAGSMIYVSWTGSETDILIDRADGTTTTIADSPANEDNPALSPDGTRLAYNVEETSGRQIAVQDLGTGEVVMLPRLGDDSDPVWSPDGTRLAFVSNDGTSETIYVVPSDGSAAAEPLGIPSFDQVWYLDWPA